MISIIASYSPYIAHGFYVMRVLRKIIMLLYIYSSVYRERRKTDRTEIDVHIYQDLLSFHIYIYIAQVCLYVDRRETRVKFDRVIIVASLLAVY